ncbi:ALK and LTK ligand 1 [Phascolarctos cinereus]|uniref:Protein FAM150A n=1 Tax=Phascolarctos cinereus TaxID=38626 RepID=A0A6P5M011_PHACI|nr:protein FAM150A [Phascolarctos cinereus]XP_020861586.1 protein FAM150A [Phascolarctos cinereus]
MRAVSEWPKLPTLFLFILALASQESQGSPRGRREAGAQGDKERLLHLLPAPVASSSAHVPQQLSSGRVRSSRQRERVVYAATSSSPSSSSEPPRDRDDRTLRYSASSSIDPASSWLLGVPRSAEILPRDLNLKEKFIKHFTGPVTFSAECSKHFHRLYHNTRDCTIPAYYKRCARLLTRLAVSPLCTQP